MVWKLPSVAQNMAGPTYQAFRLYWSSQVPRPNVFPILSNIVHVMSSASQWNYDVWVGWMPETMPVEHYLTVPFEGRFALWLGSFSLLQIIPTPRELTGILILHG